MNLKLKNTLIITGTLVLGLLIGILICGRFTKIKLDRMKSFYTEKGFRNQFMRTVKPTREQMEQLAPLFKENMKKNRELMVQFRQERQELYKEFREATKKILTPEQLQQLDKLEMRHQKMMRNKMRHNNKGRKPSHRPGQTGN